MKRLERLLRNIIGTLLLTLIAFAILLSTPWGLQQIVNAAAYGLKPGGIELNARGIHGNVFDLSIATVQLKNADFTLNVTNLGLHWHPWDLLDKRVVISKLRASDLQIQPSNKNTSKPSSDSNKTLPRIALPWPLYVENIQIKRLVFNSTELGSVTGSLHWQNSQLEISQLTLSNPNYRLNCTAGIDFTDAYPIHGTLYWQSDRWLNSGKLSLAGNLNDWVVYSTLHLGSQAEPLGQLVITGMRSGDTLKAHISGDPLSGQLAGQAQLNLLAQTWQFDLDAQQLHLNRLRPALPESVNTELHLQGRPDEIQLQASAATDGNTASLALRVKNTQQAWDIAWQNFTLHTPIGVWQTNPVDILIGPESTELPLLCLSHNDASLCGRYHAEHGNWQAEVYSKNLDLNLLQGLLPGWHPTGSINLHATASQNNQAPLAAKLQLQLADLGISHPLNTDLKRAAPALLDRAEFNLQLENGELSSRLSAAAGTSDQINGTFNVHHLLPGQEASVEGKFTANLHQLGLLDAFIPEVYNLTGNLQASMQVDGSLAAPHYRGSIILINGSVEIPVFGITLQQLNASLQGDNQDQLKLIANARSGDGVIRANGNLTFAWGQPIIQAELNGENFLALDLPSAQVVVSPTLSYSQTSQGRALKGVINIVSANIDASAWRNTASNSADVVITSNATPPAPAIPFSSQLQLILGDNIVFTGFGIHTNLTGKLMLNTTSSRGTLANGSLNLVDGVYAAYGKRFTINKGSLSYTQAPLTNPTFEITAIYQLTPIAQANALNQITIGVQLLGTLQNPQLSLFSTPAMSQEDILSYIVLGVPLSQTQTEDSSALAQAALSFALSGGNKSVLQGIQQQLGLNQLSFGSLNSANPEAAPTTQTASTTTSTGSTTPNDTALFVSKQVSSRMYVSYGVGLFNSQQIFRTQFILTPSWSIWTDDSSQGSGADLIYTIER